MEIILGFIFLLLGFIWEITLLFTEEDKETKQKIADAGICGALIVDGLILILLSCL